MRLSRDKINHISKLIIEDLKKSGLVEFEGDPNDARLEVVKIITDELKIDDVIDEEVRRIIASYSREIPEGSGEWDVMYKKLYEEVFNRRKRF